MKYPIHERFFTFQGEGVHMGRSAFFVRTYGCPVHCTFCDSAGTWHPNWTPKHVNRLTAEEIVDEARQHHPEFIVLTGGEPIILDLDPLLLAAGHISVHLETSGAFELKGSGKPAWITLSPKKWSPPRKVITSLADEFKIIVQEPEDIELYTRMLIERGPLGGRPIWLHPEWSQRQNPEVLGAISNAVKANPGWYRAGWQLHKLYDVDRLDPRSKPLVPLGGDPQNGY